MKLKTPKYGSISNSWRTSRVTRSCELAEDWLFWAATLKVRIARTAARERSDLAFIFNLISGCGFRNGSWSESRNRCQSRTGGGHCRANVREAGKRRAGPPDGITGQR